jgi:WD40 repeat protein
LAVYGEHEGKPDQCLVLWDAKTFQRLRAFVGHGDRVFHAAFSPDDKLLASMSKDGTARLWDVATGEEIARLEVGRGFPYPVFHRLTFAPGGKRLATLLHGGNVKLWDLDPKSASYKQCLHDWPCRHGTLLFTPEGKHLLFATAAEKNRLHLVDAETGDVKETWTYPGKDLNHSQWLPPGGKTLAALDQGTEEVYVCDLVSGSWQRRLAPANLGQYYATAFSPDGKTVARGGRNGQRVRFFDLATGKEQPPRSRRGHAGPVTSVAFSPDGRTLASGSEDRAVRLWDLAQWGPGESLPPARTLEGHSNQVFSVAFSPDGRLLASGSSDQTIILWDVATGRKVHELAGHSRWCSLLAFSPDGLTLAAGTEAGAINRWDVATGLMNEPLRCHAGVVRAVAYSPDGRLLASAGHDQAVRLIELPAGRVRHVFRGGSKFTSVAFSPDGGTLAAGSDAPDSRLRLWDVETGTERALSGHANHVVGVAFHPAGWPVASCGADATVRLWDGSLEDPKGKRIELDFPGRSIRGVAFSPEGRHLAAAHENGLISVLRLTP